MNLIILGAGGYGHTVADVAEQLNKYQNIIFLDDATEHPCSEYANYAEDEVYPAFGNNRARLDWVNRLEQEGFCVPTLVHPTAYVSPKAKLCSGTVVLPKAAVNTDVVVEKACIINLGALIDHGCVIEEGCHICLGAIVKGENRIQSMTKIEAGEVIEARIFPVTV